MKFKNALNILNESQLNEGVIESILGFLKEVIMVIFGKFNNQIEKNITDEMKNNSKVDTINTSIKLFNEFVPKVELNKTYNSKSTPFMDVYININSLSADDKELVINGVPEKIKFTIIGYGKRKANPKVGKSAPKDFNFSVVGNTTLTNEEVKKYVQTIFESTYNDSKNLGIKLDVSEIRGNLGFAKVEFDSKIYKPKEDTDATKKLTQTYILPKTNSSTIPSITFKIAEIQGYPSKLYFKFNFTSDVLDKQNNPIITKNEVFKKAKDVTQPKIEVMNNVLASLTNDINSAISKTRDNKFTLNPLVIHKESSGLIVLSNGYLMVDVDWNKK